MAFFTRVRSSSGTAATTGGGKDLPNSPRGASSAAPAAASSIGGHMWRTNTLERKTHGSGGGDKAVAGASTSSPRDEADVAERERNDLPSSRHQTSEQQALPASSPVTDATLAAEMEGGALPVRRRMVSRPRGAGSGERISTFSRWFLLVEVPCGPNIVIFTYNTSFPFSPLAACLLVGFVKAPIESFQIKISATVSRA